MRSPVPTPTYHDAESVPTRRPRGQTSGTNAKLITQLTKKANPHTNGNTPPFAFVAPASSSHVPPRGVPFRARLGEFSVRLVHFAFKAACPLSCNPPVRHRITNATWRNTGAHQKCALPPRHAPPSSLPPHTRPKKMWVVGRWGVVPRSHLLSKVGSLPLSGGGHRASIWVGMGRHRNKGAGCSPTCENKANQNPPYIYIYIIYIYIHIIS